MKCFPLRDWRGSHDMAEIEIRFDGNKLVVLPESWPAFSTLKNGGGEFLRIADVVSKHTDFIGRTTLALPGENKSVALIVERNPPADVSKVENMTDKKPVTGTALEHVRDIFDHTSLERFLLVMPNQYFPRSVFEVNRESYLSEIVENQEASL